MRPAVPTSYAGVRSSRASDGLHRRNHADARQRGGVPVVEYAAAALDAVNVQGAAGAEDLQPAGAVDVPKPYRPVAGRGTGAIRGEVAEGRVGEAQMHTGDRAGGGARARLVGPRVDLPGQQARGQGEAAAPEAYRFDRSDAGTR